MTDSHQKKAQEVRHGSNDVDIIIHEDTKNLSGEKNSDDVDQFHCNICDVFCTDEENFMNHMDTYHVDTYMSISCGPKVRHAVRFQLIYWRQRLM